MIIFDQIMEVNSSRTSHYAQISWMPTAGLLKKKSVLILNALVTPLTWINDNSQKYKIKTCLFFFCPFYLTIKLIFSLSKQETKRKNTTDTENQHVDSFI